MTRRRAVQAGGAAVVALGLVLGLASPAFAHAQLLGTSPADGATLASAPADVILTFGEAVQAPPTAIEVFGATGRQLRTGPVTHPAGRADQVAVTLPADARGTYVVSWRVISADTHPVQGAFTFSVGAASSGTAVGSLERHLLATRHPSRAVGLLTGALRFLILLAVIVAVGASALLVRWPSGLRRRAVRVSLLTAAGGSAIMSALAVLAQGPYDAGKPLPDAFHAAVLSPVLHSNFGTGAAIRIGAGLLTLAGVVAGLSRRPGREADGPARRGEPRLAGPPPWWLWVVLAGNAGLVVSLSLSGHATTGRWEPLGFVADLVHVAAACVWVGGLIVLAALLGPTARADDANELVAVVRRFSTTAAGSVAVIVASGVFEAWRQVASWKALSLTDYGTLLLLKVTLVVAAVEAGWFSRRWVATRLVPAGSARPTGPGAATASDWLAPATSGGSGSNGAARSGPAAPRFRRWLAFEAVIGIGVVALTGALIDAAPPQGEKVAAAARAYTHRTSVGPDSLSVVVYPLVPGTAHLGVQLTDRATAPVDAFQVTAQLSLPSRHIGPIQVPLTHQFTGSWVADDVVVPLAGHWRLQVGVLTDPVTEIDRTFAFTVFG